MLGKINTFLVVVLFLVCGVTYVQRNNYKTVDEIVPEVLTEPLQRKFYHGDNIVFVKDGYKFDVTPLYDYKMSGLLVSKMDYRFFSIYKYDSIFPLDVCVIWGSNVKQKVYKNKTIKFSQDCRWCNVSWHEANVDFNFTEISNNHLLINNKEVERKMKTLLRGDQIQILGKLVNVKAVKVNAKDASSPEEISWQTSTDRTDSGAGACEIIYVDDIKILKKANVIPSSVFQISLYSLVLLCAVNVLRFLWLLFFR
jgi:hypothetical protein